MVGYEIVLAEELGHHHHAVEQVIELNLFSSYTGGFSSLFSIWFFCLLQISPFFLAFLLGTSSMNPLNEKGLGQGIKKTILAGVLALTGFSIIFTIIGASATSSAIILYRHLSLLNQLGGIFILLIGLFFLGIFTLPWNQANSYLWPALYSIGAIFFGMALAFAYKPCVTPTLSEIFNYTKDPRTVNEGAFFLVSYSAGVSTSLLSVGVPISSLVLFLNNPLIKRGIRILSGFLLISMGIMILKVYIWPGTDWMVAYKSILVGGFVK